MTQAIPHDADETPQNLLLEEWKRLTREGLAASRTCHPTHAMAWHMRALRIAHRLLVDPEADVAIDDRLGAFVVAHLNIADCYAEMGEPSSAAECLCCAHHHLMALLGNGSAPAPLPAVASRHLRHVYTAMIEHRDRHGEHPLIDKALGECRAHMPTPGTMLH